MKRVVRSQWVCRREADSGEMEGANRNTTLTASFECERSPKSKYRTSFPGRADRVPPNGSFPFTRPECSPSFPSYPTMVHHTRICARIYTRMYPEHMVLRRYTWTINFGSVSDVRCQKRDVMWRGRSIKVLADVIWNPAKSIVENKNMNNSNFVMDNFGESYFDITFFKTIIKLPWEIFIY